MLNTWHKPQNKLENRTICDKHQLFMLKVTEAALTLTAVVSHVAFLTQAVVFRTWSAIHAPDITALNCGHNTQTPLMESDSEDSKLTSLWKTLTTRTNLPRIDFSTTDLKYNLGRGNIWAHWFDELWAPWEKHGDVDCGLLPKHTKTHEIGFQKHDCNIYHLLQSARMFAGKSLVQFYFGPSAEVSGSSYM